MSEKELTIDELATFCKRKGFVFKSSEIYGGFSGFWDFGPLGVEFFNNLKKDFWNYFVHQKENMVGIESSIISHPKTWKASGHIANFSDVALVNKKTKQAMKIDASEAEAFVSENPEWQIQGAFNLMFKTTVGALNPTDAYLRGETAQGMFLDFNLVEETSRQQLPFGILQIGRCFRNEIAPRDFLFRSREFHIGEFEFFLHPKDFSCPLLDATHKGVSVRLLDSETQEKGKDTLRSTTIGKMVTDKKLDSWHAYWLAEQILWFTRLGLSGNIKIREHMKSELSHYSSATFDLDYEYPFGSREIAGNANRGQYDLTQHAKEASKKLDIFDEATKERVIPRVLEPTFGMERIFLALLCEAYTFDQKRNNVVLKLPSFLAPITAAVFPIVKKPAYESIARELVSKLRLDWNVAYDVSGTVGRRYARQDESGTPYCITIDEHTESEQTITIRDRDTTAQIRVPIQEVSDILRALLRGEKKFLDCGKKV